MINEDGDVLGNLNSMPKFAEDFIRVLPSLSLDYTNPKVFTTPVPCLVCTTLYLDASL
jgi:hypothetical protein